MLRIEKFDVVDVWLRPTIRPVRSVAGQVPDIFDASFLNLNAAQRTDCYRHLQEALLTLLRVNNDLLDEDSLFLSQSRSRECCAYRCNKSKPPKSLCTRGANTRLFTHCLPLSGWRDGIAPHSRSSSGSAGISSRVCSRRNSGLGNTVPNPHSQPVRIPRFVPREAPDVGADIHELERISVTLAAPSKTSGNCLYARTDDG